MLFCLSSCGVGSIDFEPDCKLYGSSDRRDKKMLSYLLEIYFYLNPVIKLHRFPAERKVSGM